MSLKMKLVSGISIFLLILGLIIIGIFVAPTATIVLDGSIFFEVTDAHATVQGKITGSKEAEAVTKGSKEINLNTLTFESGKTTDVSSWEDNKISFKNDGSAVTITVTITNLATDCPLNVTIKDTAKTVKNIKRNMTIGANTYTGDVITVPKAETGKTDNIVVVTLTLDVTNPNASVAADATYGYLIELNNDEPIEEPAPEEPEGETIYTVAEWAAMEDGKALGFTISGIEASVKGIYTIDWSAGYPQAKWKTSGAVVIPSKVKDEEGNVYTVTSIADNAFYCTESVASGFSPNITSVVIPDSVTSIGAYAFNRCTNLTSIDLSSVETIGNSAFGEISSIEKVIIDDINNYVGKSYGSSLDNPLSLAENVYISTDLENPVTSITVPNTVTSLESQCFSGCKWLKSISIPDTVKIIKYSAFSGCTELTSINLSGVETIEAYAFNNCIGLTSIVLSNVKTVGDYAFNNCSLLNIIFEYAATIPSNINNSGVKSITIQSGEIPAEAFKNNTLLTSVTLGSGVTSIGASAFSGCTNLTSIDLSSVETIKDYAFSGCSGLTGELTLPESVTSIGASAFSGCSGLSIVTLDLTKVQIGRLAFPGISIRKLIIDDINDYVNSYGTALEGILGLAINIYFSTDLENPVTSVEISDSVTSLGMNCFANCRWLKNILIPVTVTSFSYNTFYESGLKNIYYEGSQEQWNVISSVNDAAVPLRATIHYFAVEIPDESKEVVQTIEYWNNLTEGALDFTISGIEASVKGIYTIDYSAGYPQAKWKTSGAVVIPSQVKDDEGNVYTVTSIADNAFYCTESVASGFSLNITSVVIPDSVKSIGSFAFRGCNTLTSIDLSSVETIGNSAFEGISSIEKVIIDDINNYVGKSYGSPSDNLLSLAENVYISTNLENPATSITVPSTVTRLDMYNFANCKWLKSISIPVTVTSFSYCTFYNCGLEDIYYEGSQEQWNAINSVNDAAVPLNATIHYNQTI